jgi:hypothetical protein
MSDAGDALRAAEPDPAWDPPGALRADEWRRWQEARRTTRRDTAMGCGIAAVCVVGSVLTLIIAAMYAIGNTFTCADSGQQCNDPGPWVILGLGFGATVVVTVIMVRARRSPERADRRDAGG